MCGWTLLSKESVLVAETKHASCLSRAQAVEERKSLQTHEKEREKNRAPLYRRCVHLLVVILLADQRETRHACVFQDESAPPLERQTTEENKKEKEEEEEKTQQEGEESETEGGFQAVLMRKQRELERQMKEKQDALAAELAKEEDESRKKAQEKEAARAKLVEERKRRMSRLRKQSVCPSASTASASEALERFNQERESLIQALEEEERRQAEMVVLKKRQKRVNKIRKERERRDAEKTRFLTQQEEVLKQVKERVRETNELLFGNQSSTDTPESASGQGRLRTYICTEREREKQNSTPFIGIHLGWWWYPITRTFPFYREKRMSIKAFLLLSNSATARRLNGPACRSGRPGILRILELAL